MTFADMIEPLPGLVQPRCTYSLHHLAAERTMVPGALPGSIRRYTPCVPPPCPPVEERTIQGFTTCHGPDQ